MLVCVVGHVGTTLHFRKSQGCQLSFMVENCKHFDILPTGKVGNSGKSKKKKKKKHSVVIVKLKKKACKC